jgi:tRNA U34 5-carboxymethylaminomethyl modifying GTPase MnmE/TrmE
MSYLDSSVRTYIRQRIERKTELLIKAEAQLEELLDHPLEDYKFDSNEGSQRSKRRKIDDLKSLIDSLEAEIDQLTRKLRGGALAVLNLRRV